MIKKSERFADSKMLVLEMFDVWGKAWGDKLKDNRPALLSMETIDIWTVSLVQAQMTQDEFEVALALSISAQLKWPPASPSDFLALARGHSDTDAANYYQVYEAAANGKYEHITAYVAAERFGFFEIVREPAFTASKRFKVIYEQVCQEYALDSAKFEQKQLQIERKRESDTLALEKKSMSLEEQSAIATAALAKLGIK